MLDDPTTQFRLDGRVAVLTGASSGLGRRFASVLAAAGARVVLGARRTGPLEELASSLPDALALTVDVTLEEDRHRLIESTLSRYGQIDILVNNAGTVAVTPALDEAPEDFRRVVDVNLVAPFAMAQLAGREMVNGSGGVVVNIASVLGLVASGRIPQASYSASKGGVVNLTRELAAQWARKGIRVNALAPGWFASEMTREMFESERGQRFIETNTPMGRAGAEDELDGALLFLASDASSFMTGQVLCIDGGWTAV